MEKTEDRRKDVLQATVGQKTDRETDFVRIVRIPEEMIEMTEMGSVRHLVRTMDREETVVRKMDRETDSVRIPEEMTETTEILLRHRW